MYLHKSVMTAAPFILTRAAASSWAPSGLQKHGALSDDANAAVRVLEETKWGVCVTLYIIKTHHSCVCHLLLSVSGTGN